MMEGLCQQLTKCTYSQNLHMTPLLPSDFHSKSGLSEVGKYNSFFKKITLKELQVLPLCTARSRRRSGSCGLGKRTSLHIRAMKKFIYMSHSHMTWASMFWQGHVFFLVIVFCLFLQWLIEAEF